MSEMVDLPILKTINHMRSGGLELADQIVARDSGAEERWVSMTCEGQTITALPEPLARLYAKFTTDSLEPAQNDTWVRLVRHCRQFIDSADITAPSDGISIPEQGKDDFIEGIADMIGYAKPASPLAVPKPSIARYRCECGHYSNEMAGTEIDCPLCKTLMADRPPMSMEEFNARPERSRA